MGCRCEEALGDFQRVGLCDGKEVREERRGRTNTCSYIPGIACLAFNHDGTKLAIACSYTFEQGTTGMELPNHIAIRSIRPADVLPKKLSVAQ